MGKITVIIAAVFYGTGRRYLALTIPNVDVGHRGQGRWDKSSTARIVMT